MDRSRLQCAWRREWAIALLALVAAGMSGCQSIGASLGQLKSKLGDTSLADRCADIMQQAFPGSDISITSKQAAADTTAATMTAIVAQVQGVRKDVPAGLPVRHDLSVECQFENGILTGFRWTAGPLQ
jgi:hypothetical protein